VASAIIAVGLRGETLIEVDVSRTDVPGVGVTACWECEGTGDWSRFLPDPSKYPDGFPCVECKGTGWRFVSIQARSGTLAWW
jgi:hypothetical protein